MTDYSAARERVKRKIEEKCLLTGLDVPGRGGERNSWMFYMRPGLFDPHFMEDVGMMFLHRCREEIGSLDFQICGLETGAVPLVVGLPMVAAREGVEINAFSVNYPRLKPWACHSNSRQPLNGCPADDYRLIDAAL